MKSITKGLILALALTPSLSFAKGAIIIEHGDELFEVEGAPVLEDGFSVGYACQHVGVLGADFWTWDCQMMGVSIDEFTVADLDPEFQAEMEAKFTINDRIRSPWNQYGGAGMGAALIALMGAGSLRKRKKAKE
jgi:hypothetical protein